MKKITSLVLAVILAIFSSVTVSAKSADISVYLEGNEIDFDVKPQTVNGRTMVPVRAIFEAMGASVTWDKDTKTVKSVKGNTTVKMTLNSTTEYIDGIAYKMDVPPIIINGRTLVPARYVAEAFGYFVSWDQKTKKVLISKHNHNDNINTVVETSTYEGLLTKYSAKLKAKTATLCKEFKSEAVDNKDGITGLANIYTEKIQVLADICVEGVQEMAELYSTTSVEEYAEYQEWAIKLQEVYRSESLKISDLYMELCRK